MFVLHCCVHVDVCENSFIVRKVQPGKETKLKSGQSLICCKPHGRVCILWIRSLWEQSLLCLGTLDFFAVIYRIESDFFRVKAVHPHLQPGCGPTHPPQPHLGLAEKWLLTLGMSILWNSFYPALQILWLLLSPGACSLLARLTVPGNFSVFLARG